MNLKAKTVTIDGISALFILLFVYAALTKVMDYQKFRIELGKSPLLNSYAKIIAITIPGIELLISLLIAIKQFQYYALYLAFSLMAVFSAYIVAILKFSPYVPCSCGGILQNMTWTQHLIFNMFFLGLGVAAILLYPKRPKNLL
ncbi:MauE/DoxX family redox-associated membrane protein [Pedobacter sp. HMWF019]|uniref:MauE/DoxX family redox-associated membrane protein n=1 Tax=Pedobacter sp. HMWF019 TaxID=2056856 RepID=UPI001304BBF5|nr:MauE/DoxX family redox-associated membrane protein [Pedobacter sp. HMWF019]